MTELAFALRRQRRTWTVWACCLAAYAGLIVAEWPTVHHGSAALATYVHHLPRGLAAAFGVTTLATPAGYLGAELFTVVVPFLLIAAAVLATLGLTAGAEDQGWLETLLALPVPRWRVLLLRGAAALLGLCGLGVVLALVVAGGGAAAGLRVAPGRLVAATLAVVVLAALHAALAYFGAGAGLRRGRALAGALGVAVAGYAVNSLLPLARPLAGLAGISPWHWTVGQNPLQTGLPAGGVLGELAVAAALVAVGTWAFGRRDIRVV